jgi:taurine dioxygenase
MPSSINIEPLSPVLGARITGIDLGKEQDDRTVQVMLDAFRDFHVLCFPAQEISPDDQVRFANYFGRADGAYRGEAKGDINRAANRGLMLVSNIRKDGKLIGALPDGEMQFHSDGAHRESPYRGTTLLAIKIPSKGGETVFANLHAAYDALSDDMKDRIEDLMTCCVYDYDAQDRTGTDINDPRMPRAFHRLVKIHPDTGRKTLYLSRLMTRYIVDMDPEMSEKLLVELFDHAEKPEFIHAHSWTPGDLLLWDNRCLNHARTDFPAEEERLLRRYTISEPDAG